MVEFSRRVLGEESANCLGAPFTLSVVLNERERHADVATILETILAANEQNELPYRLISTARINLSAACAALGRTDEGRGVLEEAIEEDRTRLGPEHPITLAKVNNLANFLADEGELELAAGVMEEVVEARRRVLDQHHDDTIVSLVSLCSMRFMLGERARAEEIEHEILDLLPEVAGGIGSETLEALVGLVAIRLRSGRLEEAFDLATKLEQLSKRRLLEDHWLHQYASAYLGTCLARLGRYEGAEARLLPSVAALERDLGPGHAHVQECRRYVASLYMAWGKPDLALPYQASEATPRTAGE